MISPFRKIRIKLINGDKASRYILYAIGEIALVVIGILIALQINNWNQKRQLIQLEQSTLGALLNEFMSNESTINECLLKIQEVMLYGDSVRAHLGPNTPSLSHQKFNDWFGEVGETVRCPVSIDVLEDIGSSGNLKLISNDDIRRSIGKWSSSLRELEREEDDWANDFSSSFLPYSYQWMSWDDVDQDGRDDDPKFFKSRFLVDSRKILQQFEFSNIMSVHYWRMGRIESRTKQLLDQTKDVIFQMKNELEIIED